MPITAAPSTLRWARVRPISRVVKNTYGWVSTVLLVMRASLYQGR